MVDPNVGDHQGPAPPLHGSWHTRLRIKAKQQGHRNMMSLMNAHGATVGTKREVKQFVPVSPSAESSATPFPRRKTHQPGDDRSPHQRKPSPRCDRKGSHSHRRRQRHRQSPRHPPPQPRRNHPLLRSQRASWTGICCGVGRVSPASPLAV